MALLVLEPDLPEIDALLARRRALGSDRFDEVWDGVLHLSPHHSSAHAQLSARLAVLLDQPARDSDLVVAIGGFNLGRSVENYRVPDGGLLRPGPDGIWLPSAALVLEIASPNDESWQKLPFYAEHNVDEVVIVDPEVKQIDWLALGDGRYGRVRVSSLIDLGPVALAAQLGWSPTGD